jgi:hypothetical protein
MFDWVVDCILLEAIYVKWIYSNRTKYDDYFSSNYETVLSNVIC